MAKRDYSLIGQRYGRFVILSFDEERTQKERELHCFCKCDCGNIRSVSFYRLKTGRSISCGCLQREMFKKYNEIIVEDDIVKIRLGKTDKFSIIDKEDVEKVKNIYWTINEYGYVVSTIRVNGKNKKIRLHKFIIGDIEKGKELDHIDQDKLNNRKENLRVVTPMENCNNRHKCKSWNKLGIKNVSKTGDTYKVRLTIMGKQYKAYGLKTIEEAQAKIEEFREQYKKEHNL